jgi:GNAT superfamily N-acetyltransferase
MSPSSDFTVSLEDNPTEDDLRAVREGLRQFNRLHAPDDNYRPLTLFLHDPDGKVVGGLLGETYWGWLHVDDLWLEEGVRRRGFGSRLLDLAEQEALRRGCRRAHLDTMSFQALPFYERRGYQVFGTLQDLPPGHSRYFLWKSLS